MKRCGRCKEHKEVTEFYKNNSTKDGINNCCKVCSYQRKLTSLSKGDRLAKRSEHYKEWYQQNREILLQKKREKRKDPIEKEKNRKHNANRRARMGEEAWSAWRKETKIPHLDKIREYNNWYKEQANDAYMLSVINGTTSVRLTVADIPKEMMEARRLLLKIRRMANEKCNAIT
jgi:mevalonate pyrophosphate decarboxylase